MISPNRHQTALLTGILTGLLAFACSKEDGGSSKPAFGSEIQRREAPRVRVSPVVQREMVRTLSTLEPIESEREIDMLPRIAGVVTDVNVEVGDRVEADDVLAVIDRREALAAVKEATLAVKEAQENRPRLALATKEAVERSASAKLTWEQAQRDFERNEKTNLIPRNELEQMQLAMHTTLSDYDAAEIARERAVEDEKSGATAVEKAQLALERENLNLSYTEISAPFAGTIADRMVKVGDSVSSGAAVFRLTDNENVRVEIHRPQRELAFFGSAARIGEAGGHEVEIRAHPEALPGEVYDGHILFLTPKIDSTTGSFGITIGLEQPMEGKAKPRLLPGMTVRLDVVTERHPDALVVPKRALRREGDAHFVFVVREDVALRIAVLEGFADDDTVEILPQPADALAAGDQVVVIGNRDLEDGTEVDAEPWNDGQTAPKPDPNSDQEPTGTSVAASPNGDEDEEARQGGAGDQDGNDDAEIAEETPTSKQNASGTSESTTNGGV
ncbi:MAG: efflux RND transporter periplasmic adaptor subunit [bacterium]|nr:efflux RND transporter periplasmic adaptor subunit [bacterium]